MIDTKKLIGRHKYNAFKKFNFNEMSADQMVVFRNRFNISVADAEKQIKEYESYKNVKSNTKANQEYFKNLSTPKVVETKTLTNEEFKKELYNRFNQEYFKENNVKYNLKGVYKENLKPLFYYFLGDYDNFIKCENVFRNKKCVPSLSKGLLIIGDYGNGKTSTMQAFSNVTKGTKKHFKIIGSKEAVTEFSFLKDDNEKQQKFYKKLVERNYMFDDILKEEKASSYGKVDLMEQVIEEKYRKKIITHATLNYKEGSKGIIKDVEVAVKQLGEKYGGYLYDRAFSMFNVIEFKGKSLRGK